MNEVSLASTSSDSLISFNSYRNDRLLPFHIPIIYKKQTNYIHLSYSLTVKRDSCKETTGNLGYGTLPNNFVI